MEGVACERRRHDPFVVRFVQTLVQEGMVQAAVDPVDAEVSEHNEERELNPVVGFAKDGEERVREVGRVVIDEAVAPDFGDEEGDGEDSHYRDRLERLLDFHAHLIFEVFGVLEGGFVEDEEVG